MSTLSTENPLVSQRGEFNRQNSVALMRYFYFLDAITLILPTNRGHPVKRVNYRKAEVTDDQASQKTQDNPSPTYAGI